jgi:uridylate kinase
MDLGVQVGLVVGGGNIYRGTDGYESGPDRPSGDYMGMLATVINSVAIQAVLEHQGIPTRVMTAIEMRPIAEPYIRRRATRHLEKGRVVIFGAGSGMPYFSTDTVAAQRALETKCDVVLLAKQGVDGVYTADPKHDPSATKFDEVSFAEALRLGLRIIDATAFALCMENDLPMVVFGAEEEGAIARILDGEKVGTLVH